MLASTSIDFDLSTEVHADYVAALIRVVSITPDVAKRFLDEIRQTLARERLGRLLLEFELAHAMTEAEVFEVIQTFSAVMPGLKIAVMNRDPRHHPSLEFGV